MKAQTLGHSPRLGGLIVASEAAIARAIWQRRKLIALLVGPIAVIGMVAVVRIYIERNRADRAAHIAETQRAEAERRAEELTLTRSEERRVGKECLE